MDGKEYAVFSFARPFALRAASTLTPVWVSAEVDLCAVGSMQKWNKPRGELFKYNVTQVVAPHFFLAWPETNNEKRQGFAS